MNAERLVGAAGLDDSTDVHVHLAEATKSKDGASAGVTLAVALVSGAGRPARVAPVAGIREKVLGDGPGGG